MYLVFIASPLGQETIDFDNFFNTKKNKLLISRKWNYHRFYESTLLVFGTVQSNTFIVSELKINGLSSLKGALVRIYKSPLTEWN